MRFSLISRYPVICTSKYNDAQKYGSDRCDDNILFIPAALFGALFSILFIVHVGLAIAHKRRICWSIITSALVSAVGYWLKFANATPSRYQNMHYRYDDLGDKLFTASYYMVFFAPFFLNAYICTVLHSLRTTYLPAAGSLHTKHLRRRLCYLLLLDLLPFALQLTGLSLQMISGSGDGLGSVNSRIIFSGFICQLFNYAVYLGLLIEFHVCTNRRWEKERLEMQRNSVRSSIEGGVPTPTAADESKKSGYKWMLSAIYISTLLLLTRCIYYLFNTSLPGRFFPNSNYYSIHRQNPNDGEWEFKFWEEGQYGLDAAPLFLALVVLVIPQVHPGKVLLSGRSWERRHRTTVEFELIEEAGEGVEGSRGEELNLQSRRTAPPSYVAENKVANEMTR